MPIEITMPRLSDTMESGTVIKWNVKPGDAVSSGDVVADIETDKATMEMQVYDDGVIASILADEGQTVDIGTLIAVLAEEDEDPTTVASSFANGSAPAATSGGAAQGSAPASSASSGSASVDMAPVTSTATPVAAKTSSGRVRISNVARRLAEDNGIEVSSIQGSGPSGRIIKRDVLQVIETKQETASAVAPAATAPAQSRAMEVATPVVEASSQGSTQLAPAMDQGTGLADRIVPLTNMRQTIARRLVESKQTVPHYQVTMTFNMDPLLALRVELNEQLASQGVKLSVNDFLVRACALSMYEHPEFNASFGGDHIKVHGRVNVGIAVSLPSEKGGGLVVATVRDADRLSLREISWESKRLAMKAREKGLTIDEMSDSTFTLSNLGMFGVEHFTAIINPPNSAILAVGAAVQKPVVRDGELAVGHEMQATMSSDHRVIDGAMAAAYLASLKGYIENPMTMMV